MNVPGATKAFKTVAGLNVTLADAKIGCAIPAHVPAKHALGLDPRVESGSTTRTCANTRIYGVSRSYGITE